MTPGKRSYKCSGVNPTGYQSWESKDEWDVIPSDEGIFLLQILRKRCGLFTGFACIFLLK